MLFQSKYIYICIIVIYISKAIDSDEKTIAIEKTLTM